MAPAAAQSDPQWDICQGVDQRDAKTTIEACRASLVAQTLFPNERADAYNNLGVAYSRDGQNDKALSSFDEAMRAIRGHHEPEYRALSNMIRVNRASAYTDVGDYESAIADYDELLNAKPGSLDFLAARAANQEALSRKSAGRNDAAGAIALEAVWRKCDGQITADAPPDVLKNRAGACRMIAQSEAMPKEVRDAAARTEDGLKSGSGAVAKALHDMPEANADATARELYVSAVMHEIMGKHEIAIAELDRSIAKDAGDADPYALRCQVSVALGRNLDAALADCEKAALISYRLGRYANAVAEADKSLAISPKRAPALYLRGLAKAKTGDKTGDADIAAAKANDPKIADTYAGYGVTP
jgi:tetratricopeptide (TPR) repeat protein